MFPVQTHEVHEIQRSPCDLLTNHGVLHFDLLFFPTWQRIVFLLDVQKADCFTLRRDGTDNRQFVLSILKIGTPVRIDLNLWFGICLSNRNNIIDRVRGLSLILGRAR